jgi:hypothetical protein
LLGIGDLATLAKPSAAFEVVRYIEKAESL